MSITHAALHHRILRHLVDHGFAPSVDELSTFLGEPRDAVVAGLRALQDYHGVVLHPQSAEVWVIHPFSTAPTNFWVESPRGRWWGNCAWCSLGVAALVGGNLTITTVLGGESTQVAIHIVDGAVADEGYVVHFPVPMARAWDNVVFTCSVMLLFESESAVDDWCADHRMPKGDVQPLAKVWAFARAWYGRHLDEDWTKWSTDEARALFARFDLTGPTWDLPPSTGRF